MSTSESKITKGVPIFAGITFGSGDFVSLFTLFVENLSSLLALSDAVLSLSSTSTLLPEIVFRRIIPATGVMLFVGNAYYTYQAIRMRKKFNKPYTAQPYGMNAVAGFLFVFGIMFGVYNSYEPQCTDPQAQGCDPVAEENRRVELAWQVAVAANFITGLVNIFLGFFGLLLLKALPMAAMLAPLASIGFTWLGLYQIAPNFEYPAIGFIPMFLVFTQYYGRGRIHLGNGWYLPEAIPVVIFGTVAGWLYGLQDEGIVQPVSGGLWAGDAFIEGFRGIEPYLGIVLPLSIGASFGDLMCLVSAQRAGDPYPVMETMISDGVGTLVGAVFGSPFGTVVYLGHPIHKKVGAQTGYSIMNGTAYLVLCLSGVVPVILSLIPIIAIGPIILFFGLMTCEEATKHISQRHHAAIFFSFFFAVCDYIYTSFSPSVVQHGPIAMSKGSLLSSMFWVAIIVFATDRKWIRCGVTCVATAAFAGAGIIHQEQAFENFMTGFQGVDSTSPFEFMMGYLSMSGVCAIMWVLQTYVGKKTKEGEEGFEDDHGYLPPVEDDDDTDDLFNTWWIPATDYKVEEDTTLEKDDKDNDSDIENIGCLPDRSTESSEFTVENVATSDSL